MLFMSKATMSTLPEGLGLKIKEAGSGELWFEIGFPASSSAASGFLEPWAAHQRYPPADAGVPG